MGLGVWWMMVEGGAETRAGCTAAYDRVAFFLAGFVKTVRNGTFGRRGHQNFGQSRNTFHLIEFEIRK